MVRIARGLFLLSLLTFMGAPVAYFLLMWINNTYLKGAYVGLEFTTALLLLSYFWTVGVNIALWPCVMQEKQTHKMALWNLLGGLAHIGTIALGAFYCYITPPVAAMGVVLYNLVTYTPLMSWWYYRYRAFL